MQKSVGKAAPLLTKGHIIRGQQDAEFPTRARSPIIDPQHAFLAHVHDTVSDKCKKRQHAKQ